MMHVQGKKIPPPINSLRRLIGWDEWYMTGVGVVVYVAVGFIGWAVSIYVGFTLNGSNGALLGHAVGIFVVVPSAGVLMSLFYPPRRSKSYKW